MVKCKLKSNKYQEQKELLNKVLNWTVENMQSDKGYFLSDQQIFFL